MPHLACFAVIFEPAGGWGEQLPSHNLFAIETSRTGRYGQRLMITGKYTLYLLL